ncbi:hypothetical protein Micbo1qcDRAFT_179276 [Microdochium bolleyi]|uniref:Uncharacterized protein n=1 Tax=Microdochium bolleyi TaxID=196109 RepID=A0A136IQ24_9PEZI|nr:hypothetical protein Micbo1qcDRAFT_179276 [Microdochium bolleyi]
MCVIVPVRFAYCKHTWHRGHPVTCDLAASASRKEQCQSHIPPRSACTNFELDSSGQGKAEAIKGSCQYCSCHEEITEKIQAEIGSVKLMVAGKKHKSIDKEKLGSWEGDASMSTLRTRFEECQRQVVRLREQEKAKECVKELKRFHQCYLQMSRPVRKSLSSNGAVEK